MQEAPIVHELGIERGSGIPPEVNEFEATGFTPLPSRFVRPARVAESPLHMECKLVQIVPVGDGPLSANICIAEVLCFHIARELLLPDGTAGAAKIDLIGRLGGDDYSNIRDRFALLNRGRNEVFHPGASGCRTRVDCHLRMS